MVFSQRYKFSSISGPTKRTCVVYNFFFLKIAIFPQLSIHLRQKNMKSVRCHFFLDPFSQDRKGISLDRGSTTILYCETHYLVFEPAALLEFSRITVYEESVTRLGFLLHRFSQQLQYGVLQHRAQ